MPIILIMLILPQMVAILGQVGDFTKKHVHLNKLNGWEDEQRDVDASRRRELRLEILLSTLVRVRNQNVPTFVNVCLSLRCFKAGVPRAARGGRSVWPVAERGEV